MVLLFELNTANETVVQLFDALWSMSVLLLPNNRTAPTPQWVKEGSNARKSGKLSCPLALICHPLAVTLRLVSMSMAPMKFLLIVPAGDAIPAPFGFEPPPSSVTKLEFSTRMPIPALWIEVC